MRGKAPLGSLRAPTPLRRQRMRTPPPPLGLSRRQRLAGDGARRVGLASAAAVRWSRAAQRSPRCGQSSNPGRSSNMQRKSEVRWRNTNRVRTDCCTRSASSANERGAAWLPAPPRGGHRRAGGRRCSPYPPLLCAAPLAGRSSLRLIRQRFCALVAPRCASMVGASGGPLRRGPPAGGLHDGMRRRF